ncbi:MAG: response regulator transcription factor [Gaiellales bacterium]
MKILVVEDERLISDFVAKGLRAEGYAVEVAERGDQALDLARELEPDLVVLDVMLPGLDGFAVLGALRATDPALPVVMLTARGEIPDRIRGLDLGATDYVVKPFAFAELAARIRAHLRASAGRDARADSLQVGPVTLDLLTRELEVDGSAVALSAREFALLAYLMRHPGQVLSRQQILDGVWGYDFDPRSNVVDVYVGYLRRRLAEAGAPDAVSTVRGVGYRLVAPRR